ncbi:MAG: CPBP family intramembrane glutamic endopeptidase [Bacteroidota bacterium]
MKNNKILLLSPLVIVLISTLVAISFSKLIGKWAFIPIILTQWCLFTYFIHRFSSKEQIKNWLKPSQGSWGWSMLALLVGLIPLSVFIAHLDTLSSWTVWLPWILLAIINPWLEEFYWRGLLMDATNKWTSWASILFTSFFFSIHHAVFGINSEVNSGFEVVIATFVMGIVWSVVYHKTKTLRWCIAAHFLVDFFNLSAAAFLDLFEKMS